ncbi:MAG: amidohydrolase [Dehalococcoidales bacterium]|nr:amidohydrolase [Dehalococcoidales bacterium]
MIYCNAMKIDAHMHLPVGNTLDTLTLQKERLLLDMKKFGIGAGIVIPDNVEESSIGNFEQCLELFQNEAGIFLLFPVNVLADEPPDMDHIERMLSNRRIVGMKIFPGHDRHYPDDERLVPFFELCLTHDVPFVIHTGWNSGDPDAAKWNDPKYIVRIAGRYPGLKLVICHYFWPEMAYCCEITRGCDNIFFDTSGLVDSEVAEITGKGVIRDILQRTIADNPQSVIFGTDYGMCDIGQHIELVESLSISDSVREMVFGKNAVELFGLEF